MSAPGTLRAERIDVAYREATSITRREARNFAWGMALLRQDKRRAMHAIYALARRIDDAGDCDITLDERRRQLEVLAAQVAELDRWAEDDPVLLAVSDTARHFPIPLGAFGELIQGCLMDIDGHDFETFDDLVHYCRLVAGTIGRLSVAVFGSKDPERAEQLADTLGVALQVTNILRDLVEDRDRLGRCYLPLADLERFDVSRDLRGAADDRAALVELEAQRARTRFAEGLQLLELLDWRSAACVGTMAGIYQAVLAEIQRDPLRPFAGRISLSVPTKAKVALEALVTGGAR